MNNTTFKLIEAILSLAVSAGIFPALYKLFQYIQSVLETQKVTKKTKVLSFAIDIAKGVVIMAEKFLGTGSEQEDRAVALLQKRLAENNMSKLFTDTQIRQIIQQVYSLLKVDGTIDAVKEKDELMK